MNAREKMFAIILMIYWKYKKMVQSPVSYCQGDHCFAMLLLLQLYIKMLDKSKMPLPYYNTRLRTRILENERAIVFSRNDVYRTLLSRPYEFWILSVETLQSFQNLVASVVDKDTNRHYGDFYLSLENRILITLIWLRQYPTYTLLSLAFGLSESSVGKIIGSMWIILWEIISPMIRWPNDQEWRNRRRKWTEMPNVVGSIDGTSHEIVMPQVEPQQDFYSGHRKYHCMHTQIIIDNEKNICYVQSGFLGHENDAHAYRQIGPIGQGQALQFPHNCFLLADSIYPSEFPLVTPYKSIDLARRPANERRRRRKFNILHKKRRVYVEHVIKEIKTFRVVGALYRHPRWQMASIVELCAGLAKRRADLISNEY